MRALPKARRKLKHQVPKRVALCVSESVVDPRVTLWVKFGLDCCILCRGMHARDVKKRRWQKFVLMFLPNLTIYFMIPKYY
jgi:hypothetical protein